MYSDEIVDAVVDRILLLIEAGDITRLSPADMIERGYCDPVRIFIKEEPHNKLKVSQGRFRLIFSVSLVDQLLERFFAQIQNKTEIANWHKLPSLIGIGLDKRHINAMIHDSSWFPSGPVIESDVSGWDWTVQPCEIRAEFEMRIKLIRDCPANLARLIRARAECILQKTVVFSDGVARLCPVGIWPSGLYVTGSGNSRMRTTLGFRARELLNLPYKDLIMKCVGDDSVESADADLAPLKEAYETLGHLIKDIRVTHSEDFEFCSNRFRDGRASSTQIEKSVYKWANGPRGPEATAALAEMASHLEPDTMMRVYEVISRFGMPRNDHVEETSGEGLPRPPHV